MIPEEYSIKKVSAIIRAVNHPLRRKIIILLFQQNQLKVTDIFEQLQLDQAVASQHLAVLRRAGFVITKREGKHIWYSIQQQRFLQLHQIIDIIT